MADAGVSRSDEGSATARPAPSGPAGPDSLTSAICRSHPPAPSTGPRSRRALTEIEFLSTGMVRVLDEHHVALGPWNPHLEPEELQVGLRHMLLTRLFDQRMQNIQRQGRISFYVR